MLPVTGLYGHAQRNISKSIALLVVFAGLLILTQIAIGLYQAAAIVLDCPLKLERVLGLPVSSDRPVRKCVSGLGSVSVVWDSYLQTSPFFTTGWRDVLLIGFGWVVLNCWWSSYLVCYQTGAREITRKEAPELYNLVENLAITAGLPCPRIEIVDTGALMRTPPDSPSGSRR